MSDKFDPRAMHDLADEIWQAVTRSIEAGASSEAVSAGIALAIAKIERANPTGARIVADADTIRRRGSLNA